jgi:hypothetical protein
MLVEATFVGVGGGVAGGVLDFTFYYFIAGSLFR